MSCSTTGDRMSSELPVPQFVQDDTLQQKGLRNYWGYNTIGFFAPHNEYASDMRPASSSCSGVNAA